MTLDELEVKCKSCTACGLCEGRTNLVFGQGKKNADIMLIGEGPGENEDLQGKPFVGRSGQLLDKFLASVDLSRDKNVYIANMVKCRPPKNRDPKPEEQDECIKWLREQFKIIKPKIVVCVGRISAQRLIDKNFRVTQQHGEFIDKNGTLFMGTYHPAAILRNPNNKEAAFGDWLKVRDKIEELGIEI
ncbi:MAG: uracil-DNA glycosylase [Eubacterium sp.]|nr:uracil-DNA glycosylase [Eubacterium sp.]